MTASGPFSDMAREKDLDGTSRVDYVEDGKACSRTVSPLPRYGSRFMGVIENYMPDIESRDAGDRRERRL